MNEWLSHAFEQLLKPIFRHAHLTERRFLLVLDVLQDADHGGPAFFADGRPARMNQFLERHLAAKP